VNDVKRVLHRIVFEHGPHGVVHLTAGDDRTTRYSSRELRFHLHVRPVSCGKEEGEGVWCSEFVLSSYFIKR
jgi:hypothetical protein